MNSMPSSSTSIPTNNFPAIPTNSIDSNLMGPGPGPGPASGPAQVGNDLVEDELTAMSNILLGQQFLEMDRVITFDGTNFNYDMGRW
jgi:hypothetical protein